jgi:tRNA(Arg) A34 adenosine deaminase TadA
MPISFEEAAEHETQRLARRPFAEIERETQAGRLAWLRQRAWPGAVGPRRAFEALFLEYLGLDPGQLVVRSEGPDEIFWESRNPCPTLAACESLGLDTRVVCRQVSDKPVQGFLSFLDPRLRFVRDYDHLRPHRSFCAEGIVRIDLEALMAVAIEEARQSRAEGNRGYGAVVVRGRELLARAHDTAVTDDDPLAHAEVNAIRQATRAAGQSDLCGALLLSTCEPCPMCASLAVWANLTGVAYGASIAATARLGKKRIMVGVAEIAAGSPGLLEVIPGVLAERCLDLYR